MQLSNLIELEYQLKDTHQSQIYDQQEQKAAQPNNDDYSSQLLRQSEAKGEQVDSDFDPLFSFLDHAPQQDSGKIKTNDFIAIQNSNTQKLTSIVVKTPFVCLVQKFQLVLRKQSEPDACSSEDRRVSLQMMAVQRLDIFGTQPKYETMTNRQQETEENKTEEAKTNQSNKVSAECSGVSHTFRINLRLEGTSQSGGQLVNLIHQLHDEVEAVRLWVHPCFKMQHSSNLMPLLNLCNLFDSQGRKQELLEIEIMTAQALIAARKFIQAIEKLRKIQSELLQDGQNRAFQFDIQNLCIQLEVLAADCMNQHSLQAEKIQSYQRIVQLSQDFASCKPILQNNGFPRCSKQLQDSFVVENLIQLNPALVRILKACCFSNIEAVKVASLKHIEYLFDNIGCSIGMHQISSTLRTLIKTYPKAKECSFVLDQQVTQFKHVPAQNKKEKVCIESYTFQSSMTIRLNMSQQSLTAFEEIYQETQGHQTIGSNRTNQSSDQQQSYFFNIKENLETVAIWKLYKDQIKIKQSKILHQNQLNNVKNHYNHIMESLMQLFNSTSSFLLKEIFEKILKSTIFQGDYDTIHCMQKDQLAVELRVYLIKFADKIASICQGDLFVDPQFLSNLMKSMIPTLLVTQEQIELENQQLERSPQSATKGKKKHDLHTLLKNSNMIVSDQIKSACETLWKTLKSKVIYRYNIASDETNQILKWINLNLKFLGQMVEIPSTVNESPQPCQQRWSMLTGGQMQFLRQNIDLINEICHIQVSHIQLLVPKLTEQERQMKKHNKRKQTRKTQVQAMHPNGSGQIETIAHLTYVEQQMFTSNIANHPTHFVSNDGFAPAQAIPDNITDLDQQHKLVDSIQDEFEYQHDRLSHSFHSQYDENDLLMSHQKLTHIYNRQLRLDSQDLVQYLHQQSQLNESQNRLIKLPSSHILQPGIFSLIEPLLFWLEYSIRTRDKLPLFQQIWQVLKIITQQCCVPKKQLQIDLFAIIFPHLQKVKDVCKNNTPSLDMLHFLQLVLIDIKPKTVARNQELCEFLLEFLVVFCDCIPHNLHDEIFQICEIVIDLTKQYLKPFHIEKILMSLVDKYTMRSKAYKSMLRNFLEVVVNYSQKQYDKMASPKRIKKFVLNEIKPDEQQVVAHQAQTQQQQLTQPDEEQKLQGPPDFRTISEVQHLQTEMHIPMPAVTIEMNSQDDLDNYVYEDQESGQHVLDDDVEENQLTHIRERNLIRQRIDRRNDRIRMQGQPVIVNQSAPYVSQEPPIHHQSRTQQQEHFDSDHQFTLYEIGHELTSMFESMVESIKTPFDTVCDICFFDNIAPTNDQHQELHGEKLDILISIFKQLTHANVKLFEKFLKKLDARNTLQTLFVANEACQSKIIAFVLDIASFCKTHFQQAKVNKYVIWQQVNFYYPQDGQEQSQEITPEQQAEREQHAETQKSVIKDNVQTLSYSQLTLIKVFSQLITYLQQQQQRRNNPQRQQQILNLMMVAWTYLLPTPTLTNLMVQSKINDTNCQVWLVESHHSQSHKQQLIPKVIEQCLISMQQNGYIQFKRDSENKQHLHDSVERLLTKFETMQIINHQYFEKTQNQAGNVMAADTECTNLKYLLSLIQYGLNNWTFLEAILENTCGFEKQDQPQQINSFFGSAQRQTNNRVIKESNPWVSQKFLCTKILIKIAQLYNIDQRSELSLTLMMNSMQLVHKLISPNNQTEDRACGLNLLAALCGFTRQISLLDDHLVRTPQSPLQNQLNSPRHMIQQIFARNGLKVSIQLWLEIYNILEGESKSFRNNELNLREAASVLIQMAAPRDSVYHFLKLSYEKNQAITHKIMKDIGALNCFNGENKLLVNKQRKRPDQIVETSSNNSWSESDYSSSSSLDHQSSHLQEGLAAGASIHWQRSQQLHQQNQSQFINQSEITMSMTGTRQQHGEMTLSKGFQKYISGYFYADNYSDAQLFTMIRFFEDENQVKFSANKNHAQGNTLRQHTHSQFQNTLKTQTDGVFQSTEIARDSLMQNSTQSNNDSNDLQLQNLWVDRSKRNTFESPINSITAEKQGPQYEPSSANKFGADPPVYDGFEDQIIQGLNIHAGKNSVLPVKASEEFENDLYDDKGPKSSKHHIQAFMKNTTEDGRDIDLAASPKSKKHLRSDQSPSDDLGIIDLDNDEDDEDDLFDVDDDKLPILKNIFSKKNRPNNGKSVAIGSRSQGGTMRIRPQIDPNKVLKRQNHQVNKSQQMYQKAKKEKSYMQQKPNSAQRILSHQRKQLRRASQNMSTQPLSHPKNSRNNNEPVVIYDEDNLIVDEFLTGRQRPQSGRVHRQRPLSGKVDPSSTHINKQASKEYNNKYLF